RKELAMPTPIPDYRDEFGYCPRCGRRMNDERVPDADGVLTSVGDKGLWGYWPRHLGMPYPVFVAREFGHGVQLIPQIANQPGLDDPAHRRCGEHRQPAFTREGPISGEIDPEAGC